ncbi:MAG TPA: hypothetical protein VLL06_09940 [Nitrospiraceae bacterium]|nr:hypothetical protein [Nitrospiraceae bacterium]
MRDARSRFPDTVKLEVPLDVSPRLFIERRIKSRAIVDGGLASFSSLEDCDAAEGDTALLNLSCGGCQLHVEEHLPQGQPYQLIVFVPLYAVPILIRKAVTQWAQGQIHGVKFLELDELASLKLAEAVRCSPVSSWVLNSIRFSMWSPL